MTVRRVTVPFARLPRWLDGFAERHGEPGHVADDEVHPAAPDGSQAWLPSRSRPSTSATPSRVPAP